MRISDWSSDVCSSDLWRALSKRYTKDSQTVALRLLFLCSPGSGRLFDQFRMRAGAHEVHQISLDRVDAQDVAAHMHIARTLPSPFGAWAPPSGPSDHLLRVVHNLASFALLLVLPPAARIPPPPLHHPPSQN